MKHVARTTLTLAVLAFLAAIWSPVGAWWQYLLSALLLFLIGAMVAAAGQQQAHGGEIPPQPTDDSVLMPINPASPITPDDVEQYKRREYGRKADDQ